MKRLFCIVIKLGDIGAPVLVALLAPIDRTPDLIAMQFLAFVRTVEVNLESGFRASLYTFFIFFGLDFLGLPVILYSSTTKG